MPGKFINEITGDTPAKDDLAVFFDKSKNSTAQATIAEMVNAGLDLAAGAKGQVPTIDVKVDAATSSLVNILTWGAGGGVDFKGTPTRPPTGTDEILTNDPANGLIGKTTLQQLVVAGGATILQPGTAVNTALVWNDTAGKWEPARAVSEAKNINGGATGELPFQLNTHVTAWIPLGNAGQVLTIGDIGTAGNSFIAPMWNDPVKELPTFTIADKGKQLTVQADGKVAWSADSSDLPAFTGADTDKRLVVVADTSGTVPTPPPHLEWKAAELPTLTAGLDSLQIKADKSGVEWTSSVNMSTNLKGGYTAGAFFPVNDQKANTTRFVSVVDFRKLAGVPEQLYFPAWSPVDEQIGPGWNDMGVALARMAAIVNSDPFAGQGTMTTTAAGSFPGTDAYFGGILMPNGKVFCIPAGSAPNPRIYDPATDTVQISAAVFPSSACIGGALLRNGKVFCTPSTVLNPRIYDPATDTVQVSAAVFPAVSSNACGVLLPDGKVLCMPYNSVHPVIYDPAADTIKVSAASVTTGIKQRYQSGVLLPNGKVLMVPFWASKCAIYDHLSDSIEEISGISTVPGEYIAGVLLNDGRVVLVPSNGSQVAIYNYQDNKVVKVGPATWPGNNAYYGAVLLPSGKVLAIPFQATAARVFDPAALTVSVLPAVFPGGSAYIGGVLAGNGKVYCTPYAATSGAILDFRTNMIPVLPSNFVTSPFYNRY
jgi:hypothetical protein